MKKISKKTNIATIALVLLMTSVIVTLYAPVNAQLAAEQPVSGPLPSGVTVNATASNTKAYLSFRPNPVGVGQTVLVNMWLNPALPTYRFNKDYKVTITDPDGNEDVYTMDSYCADTTAWFEFVPDQAGEWTLKFDFLGMYFPEGQYYRGYIVTNSSGSYYGSAYYEPASTAEQTLTVQEDMVLSWPPSPLPTDYWTRPVAMEHREWWPILGTWPSNGYQGGGTVWDELYPNTNTHWHASYRFHPWIQAPNTAHIAWKRQGAVAGIIGGPAGQYGTTGSAGGPDVIYAGRCYDTLTVPVNGVPTSCAVCYDLRTGEMYYTIPTAEGGVTPQYVVYTTPTESARIPGAVASSRWGVELIRISGGRLYKINPWTGAVTTNVSIAPLTGSGGLFTHQIDGYLLYVQNLGGGNYRLINWTTDGGTSNFANRVISNTSYARSSLPAHIDFEIGIGATVGEYMPYGLHARYGNEFWIINLHTGETLHHIITDHPDTKYSTSGSGPVDHGKFIFMTQRGYPICFDVYTGQVEWRGSPKMDYPWGEASFGAYSRSSGYGMYYWATYDGVYAWNWTTGEIVWNYKAPALASFESPYITDGQELYPFRGNIEIADGKVFANNVEHGETWPYSRGWGCFAMDAFTGELIWRIMLPGTVRAIADGYLLLDNARDGTMYVLGKGKSATTIEAPMTAIALGESVVLKGTVLDQSPAQPGTPCVSKESMSLQMEYLHKQMPIAGIWQNETITGVPVSLDIVDPNGNFFHIGDVTTDGYSGTFSYMWTPEIPGEYQVTATFVGDDSYGSSFAQTAVGVVEAPEPYPEPPEYGSPEWPAYPEAEDNTPMFLGLIAAVAVAIVIGLVNLWALRKRQ